MIVCDEGSVHRSLVLSVHRMALWTSPEKVKERDLINRMESTETREYEMVYIAQPDIGDDGLRQLNERLTQAITSQQGAISATEIWGKRTLAYQIKKFYEGHYILHRFQMAPEGTEELDRLLRLNENVLRYLIVRTDD